MDAGPVVDVAAILGGVCAYALAVLLSTLLIFLIYRLNTWVTTRVEEQRLLLSGQRSVAICLGAVLLSQAVLLRHAVFPIMVMLRGLFTEPATLARVLLVSGQCLLVLATLGFVSFASVALAAWLFARLTGELKEHEQILKDNQAVAIFFAFALLAITLVLNEGVEDLARSLIPYGGSGILRLP